MVKSPAPSGPSDAGDDNRLFIDGSDQHHQLGQPPTGDAHRVTITGGKRHRITFTGGGGTAPQRTSSWQRAGVLIAGVSLVLAALTYFGFRINDQNPARAIPTTASTGRVPSPQPSAPSGVPSRPTTTSPSAAARYLLDLRPANGESNLAPVTDPGHRTFRIRCGSGNTDDMYRSVEWSVVGSYTRMLASVTAAGPIDREAITQVEVYGDNIRLDNMPTVALNRSAVIDVAVTNRGLIELRVTCQFSAGWVVVRDARLVG